MPKRISATDAKNNFGGLLEDVLQLGRVDVVKHGRVVAVVLSARALDELSAAAGTQIQDGQWSKNHMISPKSARQARMLKRTSDFDEW